MHLYPLPTHQHTHTVPVGCQVCYWLMIITAVAELLGNRRLKEDEERIISLSYLFD